MSKPTVPIDSASETCRWCDASSVVPVLDKDLELSNKPGNKYRRVCLSCDRWQPACSEDRWRDDKHACVLPTDCDAVSEIVLLENYDYSDEVQEIVEKRGIGESDGSDGGSGEESASSTPDVPDDEPEPEPEPEPVEDDEDDEDDEEPENEFDCPGCGSHVEGYPDECPDCDATYNW